MLLLWVLSRPGETRPCIRGGVAEAPQPPPRRFQSQAAVRAEECCCCCGEMLLRGGRFQASNDLSDHLDLGLPERQARGSLGEGGKMPLLWVLARPEETGRVGASKAFVIGFSCTE